VLVHHFRNCLSGNILFDVEEVSAQQVLRENADLFAEQKNYGWSDIKYADWWDLTRQLTERGIKGYEISSSCGLDGWVLSKGMKLVERQIAWTPGESNK
jgi:hypothetical protein